MVWMISAVASSEICSGYGSWCGFVVHSEIVELDIFEADGLRGWEC